MEEEEEAQSQLGEVLCHAEQPLQLLSLLQVLLRAEEILKSWIQMQKGYCGKLWDYGSWSLLQDQATVLVM